MSRGHPLNISREELYKKYIVEYKPMKKIAEEMSISVGAVHKYIKLFDIPSRKRHDYPTSDKERESTRKLGESWKGKTRSAEHSRHISEAKKGKYYTPTRFGGAKKKRADGYICVYVPNHPNANSEGMVMEHHLVMEESLGRYLKDGEVVHHINSIRDDNRLENLQLMSKKEHASYHTKKRWEEKRRSKI